MFSIYHLTLEKRLEGDDEQEALNQLLVAVSNRDLRYLSDFSDLPLGSSFAGEHGRDVAGGCGYAGGPSTRRESKFFCGGEDFVGDFLRLPLHGEVIEELGDVLAGFYGWNEVVELLDEESVAASHLFLVNV